MRPRHLAGPNALRRLVAALAGCAPRSLPADQADPSGGYQHPAGTVAGPATAEGMRADGIEPAAGAKPGG